MEALCLRHPAKAAQGKIAGNGSAGNKTLTDHERKFLEQVFVPAIGLVHREESSRLGSWLMGLDQKTAGGDFSVVSAVVTFVDDYDPKSSGKMGIVRKQVEDQIVGGAILTFARIRSKAKQTRVIIAADVEQRPKPNGDDFHLYNLQIDYEPVNNVFVKKSQWIAEIK
jgi:hypothetical protein